MGDSGGGGGVERGALVAVIQGDLFLTAVRKVMGN